MIRKKQLNLALVPYLVILLFWTAVGVITYGLFSPHKWFIWIGLFAVAMLLTIPVIIEIIEIRERYLKLNKKRKINAIEYIFLEFINAVILLLIAVVLFGIFYPKKYILVIGIFGLGVALWIGVTRKVSKHLIISKKQIQELVEKKCLAFWIF